MGDEAPSGDSRYSFAFVLRDGKRFVRHLYWQQLFAVAHREAHLLAAARTVPHTGEMFAIYLALKRQRRAVHRELLPALTAGDPESDRRQFSLVRSVEELLPATASALPARVRETAEERLREAVGEVMTAHLPVTEIMRDPGVTTGSATPSRGGAPPGSAGLAVIARLAGEDVRRVSLSFDAHRALEERIARINARMVGDTVGKKAIALRQRLADELSDARYRDHRYLEFVQWVMDAAGGFVSPVVREFVRLYQRRIAEKVEELSRAGQFDPEFWRERFQALLGEVEAAALGARPYQHVTVLGEVMAGELPREPSAEPEAVGQAYVVASSADLSSVLLRPVRGAVRRAAVKLSVLTSLGCNIDEVCFVT